MKVGGVRGVLGAGRECRYLGARRGILRWWAEGHWQLLGDVGVLEAIRGHQGCMGGLKGSVGIQGPEGYRWPEGAMAALTGCRGVGGH